MSIPEMKRRSFIFISCAVLILIISACSDESDCYSENSSDINLEFYRLNNDDPDTSFYEKDTLFVLRVFAIGNETRPFISKDSIIFSTSLPVNPTMDNTTFVIGRDTLAVKYDVRQRIMSPECGVEQVFSNLDTLSSSFDSLAIKTRELDRNEINFEIYRN